MKRISINLLIPFTLVLGILASCSGCKTGQPEATEEHKSDTLAEQLMEIMLPSPSEVIEIVIMSGVKFSSDYMAPIGLEKKAVMVKHKAVSLGVYFTDFAYANFYNQRNFASEYLKAIQELSGDLGIGSILNDAYFKRFDLNLNNPDSLDAIFSDFSQNAYSSIIESGNSELLSMIGIGAAIEIMYIGVNSIEITGNSHVAIETVIEQSAVFENYYQNFMAYNSNKAEFNALISDISSIYDFFKLKVSKQTDEKVVTDSQNHFTIAGGDKSRLSQSDLVELKKMVTNIRGKLIDLNY